MRSLQASAGLGFLLVLVLLGGPGVAQAQRALQDAQTVSVSPGGARTFGPTASTSHTLQAFAFAGRTAADNASLAVFQSFSRFCTGACGLVAALLLPAGALVTSVELDACDTGGGGDVTVSLWRTTSAGFTGLAQVGTGLTPGCGFFNVNLPTPETIDNENNGYVVQVILQGGTSATRFHAVRVSYTLQVSPAPATATFNDVPTSHPFFQWIQALFAAGITSGCSVSPPLYCPDDPVTRGQMAVFISKALGLQFAP